MDNMESKENDVASAPAHAGATLEAQNAEDEFRLEEKKLVRKIDWILMPILTITLGLQVCRRHYKGSDKADRRSTTIKPFLGMLLFLG